MNNKKIKLLVIEALRSPTSKGKILESRLKYEDSHTERMDAVLANQLRDRSHSLGNHPAFPDDDDTHFEEKLMSKRFADVLKNFKRHHGVEQIDINQITAEQVATLTKIISLEKPHKEALEQLAINLVMEEFDIQEGDIDFDVRLTTDMSLNVDKSKLKIEAETKIEFDDHQEFSMANKEVYKRRMVNALIQGSAKKTNHMFHAIDDQLVDLQPILPNLYSKLMTGADYMYMVQDDTKPRVIGGIVNVEFPKKEGDAPKVTAEAITLPVLIHEIVKGVMEILSYHGLPKNPKVAQFVIDKADFMAAESWDMRLGPPIWERFLECIPVEDFGLKHHVYVELVSLPVDEFNNVFREILMGSRVGKAKVNEMLKEIKDDLRNDDFDNVIDRVTDDEYLGPEDLDNLDSEDWFM